MSISVRTVAHGELQSSDLARIGELFDAQYQQEFGTWTPDSPYGYSPADFHTLVFRRRALVAHVGFQIRTITVGDEAVTIAGTGGVLTDKAVRGAGYGRAAMESAQLAMRTEREVEFGYLGCREGVVPFYESVGWHRIHAIERCISWLDQATNIVTENAPLLICAAQRAIEEWPRGDIDLHGTPW
ncbi:GNAT family N-acetyltransferase [Planctomonas sp. JC2975]|uniref:GNAT family N-acetyltransferase n=1 Tax=Planctomonas sp. JC2975 TaxID=2729626 RepID=UPI0014752773|nr:GNAT family N-acetyltransferase [Planctomonas sp. JC2975]